MEIIIILGTIFTLLSFWYIIGNTLEVVMKKEVTHKLIMGFFLYFTLYACVSMPLALLHVHWNVFFWMITILNSILALCSFVILYQNRSEIVVSKQKVLAYIKKNRLVLILIALYILIYFMSDYSLFWYINKGAIWDQSYYAAKANSIIDSAHILLTHPKYGYVESPVASVVNSSVTWELFWSYLSVITSLSVNQVSKIVLAVVIYPIVFLTYDMLFKSLFNKKTLVSNGYTILFFLYFIYTTVFDKLHDDVGKFIYLPWYGNVLVTMLFIPMSVYLFKRALQEKKYLIILFLQLIFFNVFSAGGIMYAGLIYPALIVYWKFKKEYKLKFENILMILSIIGLIGLNFIYILSQRTVPWIEQDRFLEYFTLFNPIFLFASIGIILLYWKQKLEQFELYVIIVLLVFLILVVLDPMSTFLFNQYRFALHRFGLSVTIFYTMIGFVGYISVLKEHKKVLILSVIPFILIMQKNYDFFLLKNSNAIQLKTILNYKRESNEVIEAAKFLNEQQEKAQNPIYYCVYGTSEDRHFKTKYPEKYVDLGSMLITETKHVYEAHMNTEKVNRDLTVDEFISSDCQYLVTDSEALVFYFTQKGGAIVKTIESDNLLSTVRIVDISSAKGGV